MVNDTEPRYRLVDSQGNVVGSLYAKSDGDVSLQHGGSNTEFEITSAGLDLLTNDINSVGTLTASTGNITTADLGTLASALDANSQDITNINSLDANGISGTSLTISGNTVVSSVVASGSVTLSSGSATIDTGVSESTTATFMVALGPDTDDADVATDIRAASGGNYEVDIQETDTSVGNPTIRYDIIRVR
jgi:X-X-X-Leu-X-X-Gly heptad repeat protein